MGQTFSICEYCQAQRRTERHFCVLMTGLINEMSQPDIRLLSTKKNQLDNKIIH